MVPAIGPDKGFIGEEMSENASPLDREIAEIFRQTETALLDAGDHARDLCRRYPRNYAAHMCLGQVCYHQRDIDGALAALRVAAGILPSNHFPHFNIGHCHVRNGDLEIALRSFERSQNLSGGAEIQPILFAGLCHHRLGRTGEAISSFQRALEIEPDSEPVLFSLMQAHRESNDIALAAKHARKLLAILRTSYRSVDGLLRFLQSADCCAWLELDDKKSLYHNVKAYKRDIDSGAFEYVPETFAMPEDFDALAAAHEHTPGAWIVKPTMLHNGHGIRLIDDPRNAPSQAGWIVQRYLDKPFLFRGRKASFRIYLFIKSYAPPWVYLYQGASARFSLEKYEGVKDTLGRLPMHIGHYGVFSDRTDLVAQTARDMDSPHSVWGYADLKNYIQQEGFDPQRLWQDLSKLALDIVGLTKFKGIFEAHARAETRFAYGPKILGIDILLDDEMRPWLLEIERGPIFTRLFNGERNFNPVFLTAAELAVASNGQQVASGERDEDAAVLEAGVEALSYGPFLKIAPESVVAGKRATPIATAAGAGRAAENEINRINRLAETDRRAAEREAKGLVAKSPDDFEARLSLGAIFRQNRNWDGALAALSGAFRLRPGDPRVRHSMGDTLRRTGEFNDAIGQFVMAANLAPDAVEEPLVMAGCCHHRAGRPTAALNLFERVLETNPTDSAALYHAMRAYREIGDLERSDIAAARLKAVLRRNDNLYLDLLWLIQRGDYRGLEVFDDKALFKTKISQYRAQARGKALSFVPETFTLPDEIGALHAAHRENPGVWIVKPLRLDNGNGIRLIDDPLNAPDGEECVAQRYIDPPMTFSGRKANLRLFLLIASYDPPRVYLYDGFSIRIALEKYHGVDGTLDRLPMHIARYGRFKNRKELIAASEAELGPASSVWGYHRTMEYLKQQGVDVVELWRNFKSIASELAQFMDKMGLFRAQAAGGMRYAYGPKILGLDLLLDATGRPWLTKIERIPNKTRMFDDIHENGVNPALAPLFEMLVFPILQSAGGKSPDRSARIVLEAKLEAENRGRFIPVLPSPD